MQWQCSHCWTAKQALLSCQKSNLVKQGPSCWLLYPLIGLSEFAWTTKQLRQEFNSEVTQCLLASKRTKPKAIFCNEVKHFYQAQLFCHQAIHLQYPIKESRWCWVDQVVNVLSNSSGTVGQAKPAKSQAFCMFEQHVITACAWATGGREVHVFCVLLYVFFKWNFFRGNWPYLWFSRSVALFGQPKMLPSCLSGDWGICGFARREQSQTVWLSSG